MKKLVLAIMIFSLSICLFAAEGDGSSLFLVSNVPLLNQIGFYASVEEALQKDNTWMMDDDSRETTAYLVIKTNSTSIMHLKINLPVMEGQDEVIKDQTLAYSTEISKVGDTEGVTIVSNPVSLQNSNDTTTYTEFGTINGLKGTTKGVYQFDFYVSNNDYCAAFQGAYQADVTAVMSAS